jgi:nicotinate-nucleotide adenylyltransferase
MRLALYGGTFDPVHTGHLIIASDALEKLQLDRLIFIPAAISPHKQHTAPVAPEMRMEMVRAAISGEPQFEVSDIELRRAAPSYSIDTVLHFRERFPDAELFYIIGEDNLRELHTWRRIDELKRLARLAVARRNTEVTMQHDHPVLDRQIDISASEIRARVANGRPIRYLVPDAVLAIIEKNQLYKEASHHF